MYVYAIPLSTNQTALRQASTFVIMVEAVRQDEDLEKLLDRLAQSIKFKEM
jgi:predicted amino acid-binding ACT domain protein